MLPQPGPYRLADAEVNYEQGELFGNAQIDRDDPGAPDPIGASVFLSPNMPRGAGAESAPQYCGGVVGPALAGKLTLEMPFNISCSTTLAHFVIKEKTDVLLQVFITYNTNQTQELSKVFTIGGKTVTPEKE